MSSVYSYKLSKQPTNTKKNWFWLLTGAGQEKEKETKMRSTQLRPWNTVRKHERCIINLWWRFTLLVFPKHASTKESSYKNISASLYPCPIKLFLTLRPFCDSLGATSIEKIPKISSSSQNPLLPASLFY